MLQQANMRKARARRAALGVLAGLTVAVALAIGLTDGARELTAPDPADPSATITSAPLETGNAPVVRVRLSNAPVSQAAITLGPGATILADGSEANLPANLPGGPISLQRHDGAFVLNGASIRANCLTLRPANTRDTFTANGTAYRGFAAAVAARDNTFYLVNHVNVEDYLASVVACELYPDFADEAYRAQAITSRTLALADRSRRRNSSFDLWASVRSQRYRGAAAETDKSRRAVNATRGQVLAYASDGEDPALFRPYFSACNAGYVNSLAVLTGREDPPPIAPLAGGQKDIDQTRCQQWTWPDVRIAKDDIFRALVARYPSAKQLNGVAKLETLRTINSDRPLMLQVVGPRGASMDIVAEDLLICLHRTCPAAARGLLSMNCELRDEGCAVVFANGRGYGHGIGMSQWGAQIRAADYGQTAEDILRFYFPGAVIVPAYK